MNDDAHPLGRVPAVAAARLIAMALAFFTNIVLGRTMGVEQYGLFVYIFTLIGLASVLGTFGFDQLLLREVAAYRMKGAWSTIRHIIRWSYTRATLICGVIICLGVVLSRFRPETAAALPSASCLLLALVLLRLTVSAIQGFNQPFAAQLPESVLQPVLILVIIAIAIAAGRKLTGSDVVGIYMIACAASVLAGGLMLRRIFTSEAKEPDPLLTEPPKWLAGAFPIFLVNALVILNEQISRLVLGPVAGNAAVGAYSAAEKWAQLVAFPLAASNLTLAPTFAMLYASRRLGDLQALVRRSQQVVFITSTLIALATILGARELLLLFGHGFESGRIPLLILTVGQLVNACFGPVGYLLMMTGHGKDAAVGVSLGVAVNAIFAIILIPRYGLTGAAIASAVGLATWNVTLTTLVWKRLAVSTLTSWKALPKCNR